MGKLSLKQQAAEIIRIAEESGVQSNYFFITTFERYQTQLKILEDLQEILQGDGLLVEKTYVKNRPNLTAHPALSEYNRTTDSANKTVSTLMRIIRQFNVAEKPEDEDPLMQIINGADDDE